MLLLLSTLALKAVLVSAEIRCKAMMCYWCASFVLFRSAKTSNYEQERGEGGADFLLVFAGCCHSPESSEDSKSSLREPDRGFESLPLRQHFLMGEPKELAPRPSELTGAR